MKLFFETRKYQIRRTYLLHNLKYRYFVWIYKITNTTPSLKTVIKISPLSSQKRVLIMQHPTFLVPISPDNFISSIFIPNILNALMIYCHDLTNKKESRNKTVVLPCRLNVFSISCVPEKPYSTSFASTFPPI